MNGVLASILLALAGAGLVSSCPSEACAEEFPPGAAEAEFSKGFGESQGLSNMDKNSSEADRLKIGGSLWSEADYLRTRSSLGLPDFSNPNTLWLYLDSRLRNDIRGYIKAKHVYDPSVGSSQTSALTGELRQRNATDLEEMKILFNAKKRVFFTVGKQKIKWGSARFWNPTDFLNSSKRDLLYNDDRRSGVSLIKTHVPMGKSNFYLVNSLEGQNEVSRVGHSLRAEVPIATSELALTANAQKGQKARFGADFSTAVHDFDVYTEAAYSRGTDQSFYGATGAYHRASEDIINWTSGLSYDYKYSDQDTLTLAVEYFLNSAGYRSSDDYRWVLLNRAYQPYYLSRHYAMVMLYFPKPGAWEDFDFTLFNLGNLTDRSGVSKFATTWRGLQDLKAELGLSGYYGNSDGEFKLAGQVFDVSLRLMLDF